MRTSSVMRRQRQTKRLSRMCSTVKNFSVPTTRFKYTQVYNGNQVGGTNVICEYFEISITICPTVLQAGANVTLEEC